SSEWDGWFIKTQSPWFDRLFQDPQFVNELKSRWNELKPELNMIPDFIKEHAHLLNDSQKRNFSPKPIGAGWSITDQQWNTSKIRGSYEKEVEYLINFVEKRLEWLDTNINALK
ncbi:MAG: CotH kinase family protein, partial [Petrimonas mucosa]